MLVRSSVGNDNSDRSPQSLRTRQQPGAACDECRRRKLRCDRQKPQCGACQTSGATCVVPATKPARGPKRGYLKTLQARISALEGALGNQPCVLSHPPSAGELSSTTLDIGEMPEFTKLGDFSALGLNQLAWPLGISGEGDALPSSRHSLYDEKDILAKSEASENNASDSWSALIQDTIQPGCCSRSAKSLMARPDATARPNSGPQTPENTDESGSPGCSPDMTIPTLIQADLDQLYMDRIHMFIPIIHHGRHAECAKLESSSISDAQSALRNAMWTLAASASAYHLTLRDSLYQRTRQELESLDQRNGCEDGANMTGEGPVSTAADTEVVQAWLLLAVHELMCVSFRRAWITAGRAFRLIQLDSGWTAADGGVPDEMSASNQNHQAAQWIEIEQRRRTFWFAYCLDRLMSLRNGSAPTFGERVSVRLPCPEAAFQYSQPVRMGFLSEPKTTEIAATHNGPTAWPSSTFHECIAAATVAGHALAHRRQATMDIINTQAPHGILAFWDRHAWLDSVVTDSMNAFDAQHPPAVQEQDPMLLFLAMVWRAIVLYLWHTAEETPVLSPAEESQAVGTDPSSSAKMGDGAAQEVLRLMGKMSELNSWKVCGIQLLALATSALTGLIHHALPTHF